MWKDILKSSFISKQSENKALSTLLYDTFFGINLAYSRRRLAKFTNVVTNKFGLILNPSNCLFVRNGGCSFMTHGKIYEIAQDFPWYDVVISLGAGATGTYHFPIECFTALAGLDSAVLNSSVIHIPGGSYMEDWLALVGVRKSQIITTATIGARLLIVPEMAKCGLPYADQLTWLATTVRQSVFQNRTVPAIKKKIILIVRKKVRIVENINKVEQVVKAFATNHQYEFVKHSDNELPSLRDQIRMFSDASIVVGSHGAGQLFTAFLPFSACVVDFSLKRIDPWYIYARMAYIRKLNYLLYLAPSPGKREIPIQTLWGALYNCKNATEASQNSYHSDIWGRDFFR